MGKTLPPPVSQTGKNRAVAAKDAKPAASKATSPAANPAASKPANPAAHSLAVRFGNHRDFVRVVFEWDGVTDYSLRRDTNVLFVNFNKNATVDLPAVYSGLPPAIGVFEAGVEDGNLVVAMSLPEKTQYRDSRIGHLVIVDLLVSPNSPPTRPRGRLIAPPTVEPKLAARTGPLPPLPPAARTDGQANVPAAASANNSVKPPPVAAQPGSLAAANPNANSSGTPSSPATPAPARPTVNEEATRTVAVFAVESANARSLRFGFPGETGVAAFQRGADLYVIFDRRAVFDLSSFGKSAEPNWRTPTRLEPNSSANLRGGVPPPSAKAPDLLTKKPADEGAEGAIQSSGPGNSRDSRPR